MDGMAQTEDESIHSVVDQIQMMHVGELACS